MKTDKWVKWLRNQEGFKAVVLFLPVILTITIALGIILVLTLS